MSPELYCNFKSNYYLKIVANYSHYLYLASFKLLFPHYPQLLLEPYYFWYPTKHMTHNSGKNSYLIPFISICSSKFACCQDNIAVKSNLPTFTKTIMSQSTKQRKQFSQTFPSHAGGIVLSANPKGEGLIKYWFSVLSGRRVILFWVMNPPEYWGILSTYLYFWMFSFMSHLVQHNEVRAGMILYYT